MRSGGWSRWLAASTLFAAACDDVASIDVADSEVLLVAVTNASGDLGATAIVRASELPYPLPSDEGARLYFWGLRRDELVDATGAPLSDEALAQLVFIPEREERAQPGCHRCMVPAEVLPKVLLPGESCAPPPARVQRGYVRTSAGVDELPASDLAPAIAELAPRLRLQWPGSCEFTPPEHAPARPLDICPVYPPQGPIAAYEAAMNDNGVAIGINRGFIWSVDREGQVRWVPTDARHFGDVHDVAALPGSAGFIYAADDHPNFFHGTSYFLVSESLEITPLHNDVLRLLQTQSIMVDRHNAAIYFYGRFFASGMGLSTELALIRCDLSNGTEIDNCAKEMLPRCDLDGLAILPLPNGTVVGVGRKHFLYRAREEAKWYCDETTGGGTFISAEGYAIEKVQIGAVLGAIDDRVFACFSATLSGVSVPAIVTFEAPALSRGAPPPIDYRVASWQNNIHGALGFYCSTFLQLDEVPDRLLAILPGMGAFSFDASGAPRERFANVLRPELPDGSLGAELVPDLPVPHGHLVKLGSYLGYFTGATFFRRDGFGAMTRRYGPDLGVQPDFELIAPGPNPGEIVAFRNSAAPLSIEVRGDPPRCSDVRIVDRNLPEWTVISGGRTVTSTSYPTASYAVAAADSRVPGNYVLLGSAFPELQNVMHQVDVVNKEVRETTLPGTDYFYEMTEITPGRFLILGSGANIWELDADTAAIRGVEVVDQDPLGGEPNPAMPGWNALGARGGVGWIAGFDVLARVVPRLDGGLRAESYWGNRVTVDHTPGLAAIEVLAPDELLLGGRARTATPLSANLTLWRVTQANADCVPARGSLGLCIHPDFLPDAPSAPDLTGDQVSRVFDRRGVLTAFFVSDVIYQNTAERIAAPFSNSRGLVQGDRWFAFGNYGYLGVAIEKE